MDPFRKILGVIILAFFAIPILFGVIWGVGVTRAVVSKEVLSGVPREVIEEVPFLLDELLDAVERDDIFVDDSAREWLEAVAKTRTSLKSILRDVGLYTWLEEELSESLDEIGQIVRGEITPRQIMLDMVPLKRAIESHRWDAYVDEVLETLPLCDEDEIEEWEYVVRGDYDREDLPACRPPAELKDEVVAALRGEILEEIPDEIEVFEDVPFYSDDFYFPRWGINLIYLLFLIPIAFIALGAVIPATSLSSFLKWSSVSTFIGGISVVGVATLAKEVIMPWGIHFAPFYYGDMSGPFEEVFIEHLGSMGMIVLRQLLNPVISVAGGVCIVALVLFALSLTTHREKAVPAPPPAQAAPPAENK